MKSVYFCILALVLAVSLIALVQAESGSNTGASDNSEIALRFKMMDSSINASAKAHIEERMEDRIQLMRNKMEIRHDITGELREKLRDEREEVRLKIRDRNITFNHTSDDRIEIMIGKINARTGLNLTVSDIDNVTLGQVLRAYLSNGRYAEVKVMPDRASEIALKRLRAKCEMRNCTVELKEVGNNRTNKTRVAYEITTEKGSKFLLIFKNKMVVKAQVDAETGEIISTRKPWWAFLAKEDNASDAEIESEIQADSEENISS